jgi:hypothetical protein
LPGGLPSTLIAPVAPAGPPDADDAGDPGAGWCVEVLRAGRLPVEKLRERLRVVAAGAGTVPGAGRLC